MRVGLVSFTRKGAAICRSIETGLKFRKHCAKAYGMPAYAEAAGILPLKGSLGPWTKEAISQCDALVFVGACGIAVRAIAPYIKDKTVDPAVVVVDETGKYAISLLSGHIGQANDFTREIAEILGAEPVITTATDLNCKFAVDQWAKKHHLWIKEMPIAKEISARILNGEVIGVSSDYPIEGSIPEQLVYDGDVGDVSIGFVLSIYANKNPYRRTLHLVPKTVTVGIGCRKGVPLESVEALLHKVLEEHSIPAQALEMLCSIDIKKEEAALHQLARKLKIPFKVFSGEELAQVEGEFTSSNFVSSVTGVDNVSERAAVLGSQGRLIVKKQVLNGVTLAMAVRNQHFHWITETVLVERNLGEEQTD
ncbi:MAG: cobalt-precorrin 5A hydrolase [Syntrophomonadaceae bacterium]|jgi:cobalt-precorrin 5A hydrolase